MILTGIEYVEQVINEVEEHEVFLTFDSDERAQWFREWLEDAGFSQFAAYAEERGNV